MSWGNKSRRGLLKGLTFESVAAISSLVTAAVIAFHHLDGSNRTLASVVICSAVAVMLYVKGIVK